MASNTEQLVCLWLDKTANTSSNNVETQHELRKLIDNVKIFEKVDACLKYIQENTTQRILLIVSGGLGREIIPQVHNLSQLLGFYVYCQNKVENEKWASKHSKTKAVVDHQEELLKKLKGDLPATEKEDFSPKISIISLKADNIQEHNAIFMWFQLFIEVLLHMRHKSSDIQEMIDHCKTYYSVNPQQMNIIEEFEKTYVADKAISWYTREACFHRLMNKALREQNYDVLFAFRVFITDIAKQLNQQYEDYIRNTTTRQLIIVYRGQLISKEELELIKKSVGEFLSMNSFLSTTRKETVASEFLLKGRKRSQMQRIMFKISINPKLKSKAFAPVDKLSDFQFEEEILIMLGALFKIEKVFNNEKEGYWEAQLSLANDDAFQLKEIYNHMREKIGDETNLDSLGKLLLRMDENEQAKKCYKRMMDQSQLSLADAHLGYGWSSLRLHKYDDSLQHFKESLRLRKSILGENHPSVAESYSFIGEVHRCAQNYDDALAALTQAMQIQEKTLPKDSMDLAATYDTIGKMYTALKDYTNAEEYFNRVLRIRKSNVPDTHPQIAAIYRNFGWMYESKRDYRKALECYEKALEISTKTLSPMHSHVVQGKETVEHLKKKIKEQNST